MKIVDFTCGNDRLPLLGQETPYFAGFPRFCTDNSRTNNIGVSLMKKISVSIVCALGLLLCPASRAAEKFSSVVVFSEAGFPAAESSAPSQSQLQTILVGSRFGTAQRLPALLDEPGTRLLALPYGSAFPEEAWSAIFAFLQRGGNLLVLGGRPFTRSAYRDGTAWKLRDYSVRFIRPLMIDQYETTPGSDGLQLQTNPDALVKLPAFSWKRSYSPVIRLSAVDLYHRDGSAGAIDARLDALAWGVKDDRKLAAPVIEIDHLRDGFDGGRWVFLNDELPPGFYSSPVASELVQRLAGRAMTGSEEFLVRPTLPLYLPGEPIELQVTWHASEQPKTPLTLKVAVFPEDQPQNRSEISRPVSASEPLVLPPPKVRGFYIVEAQLIERDQLRAIYRSGFWIRDEAYLRSGPRLTVNKDYFELDGQPLAVMGTTYMSSEVQRLYFDHPNVYVWNKDLAQIHAAGLNMIRTGWWTGWDKLCDETGRPYERTLRTLEAYLMTARKNGLPVQFNFFAFLPDVLGGMNAYVDPAAVQRECNLISSVVARFHDVPWLAWDLINEPSISQHLWTMRPNGDSFELEKWNEWISQKYPDRAALAAAWNLSVSTVQGTVPVPEDIDFTPRGMYAGHNSLKLYDFYLFAQDVFSGWVRTMREAVRSTGSQQLITVGQDEGGIQDRLSPAYWGPLVNFTTNHSWWQVDYGLWDSLMAKQPGEAMLIQETGIQRELNLDESARRTPESEAALLERKIAQAFIQGAGAIEWLWNTNSYMTEGNETPIGAVHPDGTERPEAGILRDYASFASALSPHLRNPELPAIAIVTSQAAQYSVIQDLQLTAQRNSLRALAYYDHLNAYAIAENQLEKLGAPKLAILPSPQALTDKAWRLLLNYASTGGNLLITGPVEKDEHWHNAARAAELKLDARAEPLTFHNGEMHFGGRPIPLTFDQQSQSWLEAMHFTDGSTLKEISYGKGRIFWAAYPVELAEGLDPAAALYSDVAGRIGISPIYDLQAPLSPGVLIYPVSLEDSVQYVMVSEAAEDSKIDLRDKLTGVRLTLQLPAQRAAIAIIGKREKQVVGKYGF